MRVSPVSPTAFGTAWLGSSQQLPLVRFDMSVSFLGSYPFFLLSKVSISSLLVRCLARPLGRSLSL